MKDWFFTYFLSLFLISILALPIDQALEKRQSINLLSNGAYQAFVGDFTLSATPSKSKSTPQELSDPDLAGMPVDHTSQAVAPITQHGTDNALNGSPLTGGEENQVVQQPLPSSSISITSPSNAQHSGPEDPANDDNPRDQENQQSPTSTQNPAVQAVADKRDEATKTRETAKSTVNGSITTGSDTPSPSIGPSSNGSENSEEHLVLVANLPILSLPTSSKGFMSDWVARSSEYKTTAGIVLGCVLGIALLSGIGYAVVKQSKRKHMRDAKDLEAGRSGHHKSTTGDSQQQQLQSLHGNRIVAGQGKQNSFPLNQTLSQNNSVKNNSNKQPQGNKSVNTKNGDKSTQQSTAATKQPKQPSRKTTLAPKDNALHTGNNGMSREALKQLKAEKKQAKRAGKAAKSLQKN